MSITNISNTVGAVIATSVRPTGVPGTNESIVAIDNNTGKFYVHTNDWDMITTSNIFSSYTELTLPVSVNTLDVTILQNVDVIKLNTTGANNIDGIEINSVSTNKIVWLFNRGDSTISIRDNIFNGLAKNIRTPGGVSYSLLSFASVRMLFNSTDNFWTIL